jgi:predicted membrane protein
MESRTNAHMTAQLVLGFLIAGLGLLFTLDNVGVLQARHLLRYWPVVFVAIGAAQIVQSQSPARSLGGGIWILLGSVLLGRELGLLPYGIRQLWPLLLVIVGGFVVWQSVNRPARSQIIPGDSRFVSAIAVLGGFVRRVTAQDFQGGELTAFMGGGKLDLREAKLAGEEAVINVLALMGGFEILIPETWSVRIEVVPFMGGCDDKSRVPTGGSAPRLVLRGFVMMGGVDIKN